jgi:putative selenate reductase
LSELRPYPFAALVRRMLRELDERRSIFDLPERRFVLGDPERDLSVEFHGRRAATPLGPAAGPQSQMAQNLVLSWLGGSRIHELKTVQIDDELVIPRPCIDMQTVGYNVEWSQELKLEQSLEEYVKGAMLIEVLRHELEFAPGFGETLFDMSVGYDLAGIRSERVRAFMDGMRDAGAVVERLRAELTGDLAHLSELDFPTQLSDTLTLSTFHGCPPAEIEGIMTFLLEELGLNAIVKLNPMLLGPEGTRELLVERMGYEELSVPATAFENDTPWPQAIEIAGRLGDLADRLGLGFGVKFTNTLIVENHRDFFPGGEREMYLSGPPLHVLAIELVRRFRGVFGERFPISFSAGIDRRNFPDAVALGLTPVTVCSDLLKPGGYARSHGYFDELAKRMDAVGARSVPEFIANAYGPQGGGVLANTEHYAGQLAEDPRYHKAANTKLPRKIGSALELFDCITCDKCVPVCPNDANFTFSLPAIEVPIVKARKAADGWSSRTAGTLKIEEKHQIANFADFCNDCGNCDVFCPEDGGPYVIKPRFFGTLTDYERYGELDGFHLERRAEGDRLHGRIDGVALRLAPEGERARFEGPGFSLRVDERDPLNALEGEAAGEVDLTLVHVLVWIRDGVYGGLNHAAFVS